MSIDAFDQFLNDHGIFVAPEWTSERALCRDDVLTGITLLRDDRRPLLGGDVWIKTEFGMNLTYDNWTCNSEPDEPVLSFVARSCDLAESYVRSYKNVRCVGEVMYVLVPRPHQVT